MLSPMQYAIIVFVKTCKRTWVSAFTTLRNLFQVYHSFNRCLESDFFFRAVLSLWFSSLLQRSLYQRLNVNIFITIFTCSSDLAESLTFDECFFYSRRFCTKEMSFARMELLSQVWEELSFKKVISRENHEEIRGIG